MVHPLAGPVFGCIALQNTLPNTLVVVLRLGLDAFLNGLTCRLRFALCMKARGLRKGREVERTELRKTDELG